MVAQALDWMLKPFTSHNAGPMYAAIVRRTIPFGVTYITYQHTWILYVGMATAKEIEAMLTSISGNHIAQIVVCPSTTVGTFNACLDQQHLRIPKGMQYVSEGGLAYKASEPERRLFEGDAGINNKQVWHIVFSESLDIKLRFGQFG